jgi:uncharacterized metal-binding protein
LSRANFYHDIELAAAYFVVVAEAAVGFSEKRAERGDVAVFQSRGRFANAFILSEDVAAASIKYITQKVAVLIEFAKSQVSEGVKARHGAFQAANRFLALRATIIVSAGGHLVLDHRVTNHQMDVAG